MGVALRHYRSRINLRKKNIGPKTLETTISMPISKITKEREVLIKACHATAMNKICN